MKQLFDQKQVSRLAGVSESQVRYWDSVGLIPHVEREKGRLFFDFQGLVAFRTVKALLDQGASLGKIRKCMARVRSLLPDLEQPLSYLNPDHPEANYNLASIFEERGELDNALLFYRKALHEDPECADAWFNLGRVLEKRGDLEEARKQWRQYLLLDPESKRASSIRQWLEEDHDL